MKKLLAVGVIVLFLGLAIAPSINANISKGNMLVEVIPKNSGLNNTNESIYYVCYVKSGYVRHKNVNISGFYTEYLPFFFCIGNVDLDLINFPNEPERIKLILLSFSGIRIIKENISLSLKGFIGNVRPTGSINSGRLKGFALITLITPLENQ